MAKAKRPPQTKKKLGGPRVSEGGPRQAKADAVSDVQSRLSGSNAVLLTEYRGLTVQELAALRGELRQAGADYKVYKNTLATIAARNLGLEDLTTFFEGPTAFTFASGDPVLAAKRLSDFAKRVPALVLKGGVLEGRILSAGDVNALSKLESREVMLARAAGMFLSPIQKLANLFAAPLNQLGSLLVQLREKLPGEEPGPAPATEESRPPAEASEQPAASADQPPESGEAAASAEGAEPSESPPSVEQPEPQAEASTDGAPTSTTPEPGTED